ncbi:MAG: hypothetical protein HDS26_01595 [Bacteroides sp.]|nr:hypothetical protein [Bacteroides sp.]
MKKLLLFGALGAMALGMQAQSFGDYFKVVYNGQEVENGGTIVVSEGTITDWNAEDGILPGDPDYNEDDIYLDMADVYIHVENKENETRCVQVGYYYSEPTKADWPRGLGSAQFCYENAVGRPGNCLGIEFPMVALNAPEAGAAAPLEWHCTRGDIKQAYYGTETTLRIYMQACEGDAQSDYEPIDDADFTMYIKYSYGEGSVSELTHSNAAAEYYTLDGRRLTQAPAAGLYIERRGGKVTKRLAR